MSQFTCRPAGCSCHLITSIQSGSCSLTAGLSAIYVNFIFIWEILRIQRLTTLKDKMRLMTCFTIFPLFFMFNFKVVSLCDVTPPWQTSVPCFILTHVHVNITFPSSILFLRGLPYEFMWALKRRSEPTQCPFCSNIIINCSLRLILIQQILIWPE